MVAGCAPVRQSASVSRRPSDEVELFCVPPYSPKPNSNEYLNGDLKGRIHNVSPHAEKNGLKRALLSALCNTERKHDHVRSYFRHLSVRYAAA